MSEEEIALKIVEISCNTSDSYYDIDDICRGYKKALKSIKEDKE